MISAQSEKTDFTEIEIKLLRLVVGYCCYCCQGISPPAKDLKNISCENRILSEKKYCKLISQVAGISNLMYADTKLSSIIKNPKIAKLIRAMESGNVSR